MNPITQRDRDCLPCRVISGGGLLGMGVYVSYCANKVQGYNRWGLFTVGVGLAGLSVARFLNLPPFKEAFTTAENPSK